MLYARNIHLHQKCLTVQQTPSVTLRGQAIDEAHEQNNALLKGYDGAIELAENMQLYIDGLSLALKWLV